MPRISRNSQDFNNVGVDTRGRLAGKEAEGDVRLRECIGHGEQFQWNDLRNLIVIGHRREVKRDGAASNPLSRKSGATLLSFLLMQNSVVRTRTNMARSS